MATAIDVLAVMDEVPELYTACASNHGDPRLEGCSKRIREARAAVAELAKCCEVTVKAFEALGRTDNVIAQLEAHRECERALIEQKRALARAQGGQS